MTLDEKVHAAMRKLGLEAPLVEPISDSASNQPVNSSAECQDGVCNIISPVTTTTANGECDTSTLSSLNANFTASVVKDNDDEDVVEQTTRKDPAVVAQNIAAEFGVDVSLAWAALGATSSSYGDNNNSDVGRIYHEDAARDMIRTELEMIDRVPADSAEVQQLLGEGFGDDVFMIRRALAFADNNLDDARAILQAEMDEVEQEVEDDTGFQTVTVDANFDPTAIKSIDRER